MAAADIISRTRTILYGHGLGEKPTIIQGAADAAETGYTGSNTVTFDLASSEGAKVEAGDVLSVYGASASTGAHMLYVLSVSTDTVTAVNEYWGSPAVTDTSLDGALFELDPLRGEWFLWQAMESVFDNLLYPEVYKFDTETISTPDLAYYQNEISANVMEVFDVWQKIGGRLTRVGFKLYRNVPTDVSSTGALLELAAIDGSAAWVKTAEKYVSSDTLGESIEQCVATGAAALAAGASVSEGNLESSSKDSQERRNVAPDLYREFITLRSGIATDIAKQVEEFELRR